VSAFTNAVTMSISTCAVTVCHCTVD